MEVTKENLEVALAHLKSQWVYYWKKKKENPKWVCNPPFGISRGRYGLYQFRRELSS